MITTSVHHIYGAYIYNTPGRLHVLAISIPVIVLTRFFDWYFKTRTPPYKKAPAFLYAVLIFAPSLLLIGVVEGLYNHVLKNILFFSNVPEETIRQVFYNAYDPALLEMPNDTIFELTGVIQGILVIPLVIQFIRFVSNQRNFSRKAETNRKLDGHIS